MPVMRKAHADRLIPARSACYTEGLTLSRSGETGRRAGLKIPFPSGSVGSTPTSGTKHDRSSLIPYRGSLVPIPNPYLESLIES
jgi:hypothetical protein